MVGLLSCSYFWCVERKTYAFRKSYPNSMRWPFASHVRTPCLVWWSWAVQPISCPHLLPIFGRFSTAKLTYLSTSYPQLYFGQASCSCFLVWEPTIDHHPFSCEFCSTQASQWRNHFIQETFCDPRYYSTLRVLFWLKPSQFEYLNVPRPFLCFMDSFLWQNRRTLDYSSYLAWQIFVWSLSSLSWWQVWLT